MKPKRFPQLLTGFLLTAGLCVSAPIAEAHHRPGHFGGPTTQAQITEVQPLTFGTISPGVVGGTITLSDTGGVSITGTVTSLGGTFNALVSVDSCAGSATTLTLTNGILTGPGAGINITNLTCTGPGGTSASGGCNYFGTAGPDVVAVGGTITIPAGQISGVYNGTFDIVGRHQPAC